MGTLWLDLRYGCRMLLKRPGFTAVAVLALALGIGANTAIFSVVNAVLLRPLPFGEPERLAMLWMDAPRVKTGFDVLPASVPNYLDWRERSRSFERVAAFRSWAWVLTGRGEPEQIWGARVSADLFPALGVRPALGRDFLPEEDRANARRVVIIGHGLWQRRFNADPSVVGQALTLGEQTFEVVGVMPEGFSFPGGMNFLSGLQFSPRTELWVPLAVTDEEMTERGTLNIAVIGRLKPGVTLGQAQAEMTGVAEALAQEYPKTNKGLTAKLVPLHEQVVGDVRPALLILLGTVGVVLLIACANVANLLLALATARRREISIRTALGARRARIVRQMLTESLLLALCGGAAGLVLAYWGVDALVSLIPGNVPRAGEIAIDGRILGFTLLVSLFTGLVFGLTPALQASGADVNESLKEGARGGGSGLRQNRVRSLLVVSEVALALVLLIGAALLVRSFARLQHVSPGFDPSGTLTMEVVVPFVPPSRYERPEQQAAFFQQALAQVRAAPGVESAGVVSTLPLSGAFESTDIKVGGETDYAPGQLPQADYAVLSPDYFRAMGIPLLVGRDFDERDGRDSPWVVVVNETAARRIWPGQEPLGKRLTIGFETKPREVVGVVGDVKQVSLQRATEPAVYVPHQQLPYPGMTLVVRGQSGAPGSLTAAVRDAIRKADPDIPVANVKTLDEVVSSSVAASRFNTLLFGLFAAVALVLAAVGLYGVMSYSVTQRTHEIGLRMALGAQSRDVLRMVVRQGLVLTAAGVAVGLAAAFALTRLMSGLLFGVTATDPLTFAGVPLLLLAVALLATFIPARRATRVDPMVALRYE